MDLGLRQLDRRQGWRGISRRVQHGDDPSTWASEAWEAGIEREGVYDAVVMTVDKAVAQVRVADYTGSLGPEQIKWTKKSRPSDVFSAGDIIRVRVVSIDDTDQATFSLEQEPLAEAALVAIDPATSWIARRMSCSIEDENAAMSAPVGAPNRSRRSLTRPPRSAWPRGSGAAAPRAG